MSFLRSLVQGCWFGSHSYLLEMRGKIGVQVCQECRQVKKWPKVKKAYSNKAGTVTAFRRPSKRSQIA